MAKFFFLIRGVARGGPGGPVTPPPRPCETIVLCSYNSGVQVPINVIAKITYM